MFCIRYRIYGATDWLSTISSKEFDADPGIPADVEVRFGPHTVGFCYDGPLQEDDFGLEWLDLWIENFLDVLICFQEGSKSAAFSLIETYDTWLTFCYKKGNIIANLAHDKTNKLRDIFLVNNPKNIFLYDEPTDYVIPYVLFRNVILDVANQFLEELNGINPNLSNAKRISSIAEKIQTIVT